MDDLGYLVAIKGGNALKKFKFLLMSCFLIMVTSGIICASAAAWYVFIYLDPQMDIDLEALNSGYSSIILVQNQETGEYEEQERLYADKNRIWVNLENVPIDLQEAFIAIEDKRFYKHNGVDWKRTAGAVFKFVANQSGPGGSTITQQLIKNLTGEDEVRPDRKIKEILRALKLERSYNKDEILEMYLNTIYLGNSSYGVQAAAQVYFGKDVQELDLAQCAALAGITNNPSKYNPYRYPDNVKERQETILYEMLDQGYITQEEYDQAVAEQLVYSEKGTTGTTSAVVSWFNEQVRDDVTQALMEEKGYSQEVASRLVLSGGLQIYSTQDTRIQGILDDVYMNDSNFPTSAQSSMVITDPYTGRVVALVGGRGEKSGNRVWNNASQALRQPGSAFKPLAVYTPALDAGLINYGSSFVDSPYETSPKNWPKNAYSGYYGTMSIERAIMISCNTIAVKVLMDEVGAAESVDFLREKMGFTTVYETLVEGGKSYTDETASLALGGLTKGVSVMEMNGAYDVLANGGRYIKPHTYTKVLAHDGSVLLEADEVGTQSIKPSTAYIMTKLLEKVVNGGRGATATAAKLSSGMPQAGKTGTTTSKIDLWFAGYTPYYVGVVWYGYEQPKAMNTDNTRSTIKIWKTVMDRVHEGLEIKDFEQPEDVITKRFYGDGTTKIGYFTEDNMEITTQPSYSGGNSSSGNSSSSNTNDNDDEDTQTSDTPTTSTPNTSTPGTSVSPSTSGGGSAVLPPPVTTTEPSTPEPSTSTSTTPVLPDPTITQPSQSPQEGDPNYFPVG